MAAIRCGCRLLRRWPPDTRWKPMLHCFSASRACCCMFIERGELSHGRHLLRLSSSTPRGCRIQAGSLCYFAFRRVAPGVVCSSSLGGLNHGRHLLRLSPSTPLAAGYRLEAYATLLFGVSRLVLYVQPAWGALIMAATC
jgi:hypothetical protein